MNIKDFLGKLDIIAVLGFLIAVETQVSNGSMSFAHSLPEAWIPVVKEWAANLASVGGLLVGVLRMSSGSASTTATVTKVVVAAFLLSLLLGGSAHAQAKPFDPIRDIKSKIEQQQGNSPSPLAKLTGKPVEDLLDAMDAKLLPDLKYAKALADAAGSKVTGPCYGAWIAIIETRQNAAKNADGTPMAEPDPAIVTKFEKMVELRNALQPESDFMLKCSPVASMVKKDIAGFIGIVLTGGAGIATLVPGL